MRPNARSHRAARLLGLLVLLSALLFGLVCLSYPLSLSRRELPWLTHLLINTISETFVLGDRQAIDTVIDNFTRALAAISMHTVAGGLSLALCAFQFVHAWRRRAPGLHRVVGQVTALVIAVSMVGAVVYLLITPAHKVFSGEALAAALWVLAASTLITLALAMKAIFERHILAHVGWMHLLFATLLTAPLMRLEYLVIGHLMPQITIAQATAAMSSLLFPQMVWLMAWWMQRFARHDMPLLPSRPSLPLPVLRRLGWLGCATVLHEGLLVPQTGLDLLGPWREAPVRLPAVAWAWAVASALLLPRLHRDLRAVTRHQRPIGIVTLCLMLGSAVGALLIAAEMPMGHNNEISRRFYWGGTGLLGLGLWMAGMWWREPGGRMTPVRTLTLVSLLAPSLWLPVTWALSWTGWSSTAVCTATLTLCAGYFAWNGFASAFGMPLPVLERIVAWSRRPPKSGETPVRAHRSEA